MLSRPRDEGSGPTTRLRRAVALQEAGRLAEAESLCRQVLDESRESADALNLLAVIADRVGQRELGVDYLTRAIGFNPRNASYYVNLGGLLQKLGRAAEAAEACRQALALDATLTAAHYNLGNALRDAGDLDGAAAAFETVIRSAPEHTGARTNLANLLWRADRIEPAVEHFEAVVRLKPGSAGGHNNLAAVLLDCDRFDLAMRHARAAVDLEPGLAGAHNNLGVALQYSGALEDSIEAYRAALRIAPDYVEAHHNLFWALQLTGRLDEGWREHVWRERLFPGSILKLPKPRWDGAPLSGRHIVVYAEQGIGDEIMFASCLPELIEAARSVTLQCEPRLGELFTRSFPGARICAEPRDAPAAHWREALDRAHVQVPAGDLPHVLRRDFAGFGRGGAYLRADEREVARWRDRLAALGGGMKVGIAWRGGSRPKDCRRRSIDLEQWVDILETPGIVFVDLQYGRHDEERNRARARFGVALHALDDLDVTDDLDGLAAVLSALDLVIAVDNSVIHLAGALGAEAWALLPFMPDWRWYVGRDDTPWYASVSLYRQSRWGQWRDVMERVRADLAARSSAEVRG